MQSTLTGLESDGIITIDRSNEDLSKIIAVQLSPLERDSGRENFDFYCFLIWPFIEGSWLAGVALIGLTPPIPSTTVDTASGITGVADASAGNAKGTLWVPSKATQEMAQLLGKTLYHQGDLSYFEAVNKQTIANAFLRFEDEGIILVKKPSTTPPPPPEASTPTTSPSSSAMNPPPQPTGPLYRLHPEWQPSRDPATGEIIPEGRLWDFVEKIARSRREGKNRRDGKTVSKRVVGLVGELGEQLFKQSGVVVGVGGDAVMVGEGVGRRKRVGRERARL